MYFTPTDGLYSRTFHFTHRPVRAALGTMAVQPEVVGDRTQSRTSTSSSHGDLLAFRTAKVAPLGLPEGTRGEVRQPLRKRLEALNSRLKGLAIDEDVDIEVDRTSCSTKVYILCVAAGSLALGIGVTYHGTQTGLTDFLVLGIFCIVSGVILTVVCLGLYCRELHYVKRTKRKQAADPQLLQTEMGLQPADTEGGSYFAPLGDTSQNAIRGQRRLSSGELYGMPPGERAVVQASQQRRAMSAGMRSDGVLTVSGVDVEDKDEQLTITPPPFVTLPTTGELDPDRALTEGGEQVSSSGVYTARVETVGASPRVMSSSLADMRLSSAAIKREITELYKEPTEREKNEAAVERSLSELE